MSMKWVYHTSKYCYHQFIKVFRLYCLQKFIHSGIPTEMEWNTTADYPELSIVISWITETPTEYYWKPVKIKDYWGKLEIYRLFRIKLGRSHSHTHQNFSTNALFKLHNTFQISSVHSAKIWHFLEVIKAGKKTIWTTLHLTPHTSTSFNLFFMLLFGYVFMF